MKPNIRWRPYASMAAGLLIAAGVGGAAGWAAYSYIREKSDSPGRSVAAFAEAIRRGDTAGALAFIDGDGALESLARAITLIGLQSESGANAAASEEKIRASLPQMTASLWKGLESGIKYYPKGQTSRDSVVGVLAEMTDPPVRYERERAIVSLDQGSSLVLAKRDGHWRIVEFRGFEPVIQKVMDDLRKARGGREGAKDRNVEQ